MATAANKTTCSWGVYRYVNESRPSARWWSSCPVFEGVVVLAEECQVGEGGGSAVGPMPLVVGVAPSGGPVAAGGVLAVTVTDV
jgi:hypothetical protein